MSGLKPIMLIEPEIQLKEEGHYTMHGLLETYNQQKYKR